jgi:hypothetical protein
MRIVSLLIFCLHISFLAEGQMKLCKPGDTPPNVCRDACLYCKMDGLQGRNTIARGTLPGTFCTPTTDNAQWIPFVAGSRDLTLEVKVSDCVKGSGLEMGLFNGTGCTNIASISSCFTDVNVNNAVRIVSVLPLTTGEIYWLLLDGNNGDICSWEVKVTEGSATAPDLKEEGSFFLPSNSCLNQEVTAFYTPPPGTRFLEWKVNGKSVDNKNKSTFSFVTPENGKYSICVTASNACHTAPTVCKTIIAGQTKTDTLFEEICFQDKFPFYDSLYSVGNHQAFIKRNNNCDSLVYLKITSKGKSESILKNKFIQSQPDEKIEIITNIRKPYPIEWSVFFKDSLLCKSCHKSFFTTDKNDTLIIEWINDQNCRVRENLVLEIVQKQKVILPNIILFSSGKKESFTPFVSEPEKYKVEVIQIYNRWGNLITTIKEDTIDLNESCTHCKEGVHIWKITILDKLSSKNYTEYQTVTFLR